MGGVAVGVAVVVVVGVAVVGGVAVGVAVAVVVVVAVGVAVVVSAQPDLFPVPAFDIRAALIAKAAGMDRVAANNRDFLDLAREAARMVCRQKGSCTADDLRELWLNPELPQPTHYNAWGCVFRHPDFRWTGAYRTSALISGRGNQQRVWRLA